jgi:hypothetical protein
MVCIPSTTNPPDRHMIFLKPHIYRIWYTLLFSGMNKLHYNRKIVWSNKYNQYKYKNCQIATLKLSTLTVYCCMFNELYLQMYISVVWLNTDCFSFGLNHLANKNHHRILSNIVNMVYHRLAHSFFVLCYWIFFIYHICCNWRKCFRADTHSI